MAPVHIRVGKETALFVDDNQIATTKPDPTARRTFIRIKSPKVTVITYEPGEKPKSRTVRLSEREPKTTLDIHLPVGRLDIPPIVTVDFTLLPPNTEKLVPSSKQIAKVVGDMFTLRKRSPFDF